MPASSSSVVETEARTQKGRDFRYALSVWFRRSGWDNSRATGKWWSMSVRIRHTSTNWRAQQRVSWATTGSTCFGLKIYPDPVRGNNISWRLLQYKVKTFFRSRNQNVSATKKRAVFETLIRCVRYYRSFRAGVALTRQYARPAIPPARLQSRHAQCDPALPRGNAAVSTA